MNEKTLVIIPFTNIGNRQEDEYFSDGITDELLVTLNKVKGIKVLSRTTSFYIKNKSLSIHEIAETLGVEYILEGSVRKSGDSAKITVQLVRIDNEAVLLSEVYATELESIFQVQNSIATKIAEQLKGVFDDTHSKSLTLNSEAYDLYLKGNYHWYRYTKKEIELAVGFFEKAIKLESEFALAHSGLSKAYMVLGAMGSSSAVEVFPKAKEAARKALLINNKLVEAHLSFTWVCLFYDWDLKTAKKHLDQCLMLNPNNADTYDTYSKYHIMDGNLGKAEEDSLRSIEIDPMGLTYHANLYRIYFYLGQYDQALSVCNGSLEIDPLFYPALFQIGWIYVFLGEFDKAIEVFEEYRVKSNGDISCLSGLGYAYARSGFVHESRDCLKKIQQSNKEHVIEAIEFERAIVSIGLREYDSAYNSIEICINCRLGILRGELLCNPIFHELKKERKFAELFQSQVFSGKNLFPNELEDNHQPSIIQIVSNTNEKLLLDPHSLLYIKADDNYAKFYWKDGNKLEEKLLRVTLAQLENQLVEFPFISRCHKSFMINLGEDYEISGNAKGYKFKSTLSPTYIPVSRLKRKEVFELYDQFHR